MQNCQCDIEEAITKAQEEYNDMYCVDGQTAGGRFSSAQCGGKICRSDVPTWFLFF